MCVLLNASMNICVMCIHLMWRLVYYVHQCVHFVHECVYQYVDLYMNVYVNVASGALCIIIHQCVHFVYILYMNVGTGT